MRVYGVSGIKGTVQCRPHKTGLLDLAAILSTMRLPRLRARVCRFQLAVQANVKCCPCRLPTMDVHDNEYTRFASNHFRVSQKLLAYLFNIHFANWCTFLFDYFCRSFHRHLIAHRNVPTQILSTEQS